MQRTLVVVAAVLACSIASHADEHRQLGAHQHGHGKLDIAVDGQNVSLELDAPGADIAGFEHEAKTADDKAALEKAVGTLKQPLALFKFPEAAACAVKEASAGLEKEEAAPDEHAGAAKEEHESHHADFNAKYLLDCKSPAALKSLTISYFAAFKNAQSLTVSVVTPKGQSTFEATREKPNIDLSSLM